MSSKTKVVSDEVLGKGFLIRFKTETDVSQFLSGSMYKCWKRC